MLLTDTVPADLLGVTHSKIKVQKEITSAWFPLCVTCGQLIPKNAQTNGRNSRRG